jgi:hypothetical protein
VKFVIISCRQFCGGAIVEHLLCKLLMEKGFDAKIFYTGPQSLQGISQIYFWLSYLKFFIKDFTKFFLAKGSFYKIFSEKHFKGYGYLPVKSCKRKYLPFIDDDTIVIYTETCYGNFLRAKKVVRWFLYYNQYPNSSEWYEKNDLFFSYRDVFNDARLNFSNKTLFLMNFDYDLYKKTNFEKRKGTCYILRKGKERMDLPESFDGPIIDDLTEEEIVSVFNSCEYCISYDTQTFYSSIAAFCGCLSIVIPEKGKSRKDYMKKDDHSYGIAFGTDRSELDYAISTRNKLISYITGFSKMNQKNVDAFLDVCANYFY